MSDLFDIDFDSKPDTRQTASMTLVMCSGVIVDWVEWLPQNDVDDIDLADIHFEIQFDNEIVWSGMPSGTDTSIAIDFQDTGYHKLRFCLQNLKENHMPVRESREYRSCVWIKSVKLEDFEILPYLAAGSWQRLDGSSQPFPTHIADNGHAEFEFAIPVYQWLIWFHQNKEI